MSDSVLGALGAHVAAALMTLVVVLFDTPADFYARRTTPDPAPVAASVPVPDKPEGIRAAECLDRAVTKTPEQTEFCVRLIAAAVTEVEKAGIPLGRQTSAALEEIRAAAAIRCRDLWRTQGGINAMPDSPSCLLSAQDIARTSTLH